MINNLHIKNFKSWEDTGDIKLSKITGFFGANSSGKSSILQFLLLLKQTIEDTNRQKVINLGDDKSLVRFWYFDQIINSKADPKEISFSIIWNIGTPESPFPAEFTSTISAMKFDNNLIPDFECFKYTFDGNHIGIKKIAQENKIQYECIVDTFSLQKTYTLPKEGDDTKPFRFYGFPPLINRQNEIPEKLLALPEQFEKTLRKVFYLGPLREVLSQSYHISSEKMTDIGKNGENAIPALISWRSFFPITFPISFVDEKGRSAPEVNVAKWLKQMDLIEEFIIKENPEGSGTYTVLVKQKGDSPSVPITEVGFGISQILPVLTLCFTAPENSTIIFEQPEIHLHPHAQFELADLFIEVSKDRNIQFIIESHSEHLLQRLQRRIAEDKISETDISLYFTEIENGKSKITPLHLDDTGNISNWPKEFFGNEMEELSLRTKAGIRKRKANV